MDHSLSRMGHSLRKIFSPRVVVLPVQHAQRRVLEGLLREAQLLLAIFAHVLHSGQRVHAKAVAPVRLKTLKKGWRGVRQRRLWRWNVNERWTPRKSRFPPTNDSPEEIPSGLGPVFALQPDKQVAHLAPAPTCPHIRDKFRALREALTIHT